MEHESNTAFIGPHIKDYRRNSNPENSASIRAESPILLLTEHYVMNRATSFWDGPKFTIYSSKDARLRYFVISNWPHDLKPVPDALCKAGFFFTGRNLHTISNKINASYSF